MIQTEKIKLEEIMRLYNNLEKATYGEYKTNGIVSRPSASRFYYTAKKLYESVDELIDNYSPKYISFSNSKMISASRRDTLLQLDVIKDDKTMKDEEVTWELEKYLTELQGLFDCIYTYCKKQGL